MELSLDDIAELTWLWHDAEVTKIELAYDASNYASVVLCSEINYEEDIGTQALGHFQQTCTCRELGRVRDACQWILF